MRLHRRPGFFTPLLGLGEIESIPPTEYYQNHLFLTKRNRKGKLQIRFVVLTDKKMYNFEARVVGRRIEPQKCKVRASPVVCVRARVCRVAVDSQSGVA